MPPAAVLAGGLVGGALISKSASDKAASASQAAATQGSQSAIEAANISAQSQREALEYLKKREAVPQQFREEALKRLGGLYGLEGGTGTQAGLIEQAKTSPLYNEILSGLNAGEESILRNASATGGLRSGNVQEALADYNTRLRSRALLESYNQQLQGLQGLAMLPSNANQIAQVQAGIGETLGQGISSAGEITSAGLIASGQAKQKGLQNVSDILLGGLGTAFKYGVI